MPHMKTSVSRVRSGHKKAKSPKAIAATPLNSSSHQFSASSRSASPRNGDRLLGSMCMLDIWVPPEFEFPSIQHSRIGCRVVAKTGFAWSCFTVGPASRRSRNQLVVDQFQSDYRDGDIVLYQK